MTDEQAQELVNLTVLLLNKLSWNKPANIKVTPGGRGIEFDHVGHRYLLMDIAGEPTVFEWVERAKQFLCETHGAIWLTGILQGKVRDDSGRHVA